VKGSSTEHWPNQLKTTAFEIKAQESSRKKQDRGEPREDTKHNRDGITNLPTSSKTPATFTG